MIKQKGLKITIFVLLIVFLVSAFSILIANTIILFNNKKPIEEFKVYAFGEKELTEQDYNKYDTFEVNSGEGFLTFQKSMRILNDEVSISSTSGSGFSYAGKTVVQTADIEVGTRAGITHEYEFAGTYDGQGGTITYSDVVTYDNNTYMGSFCTYLAGTVKNTRFVNGEFDINPSGSGSYIGVVTGWVKSGAKIENCIIENCKFISTGYRTNVFVGAVAGHNQGTVKNCLVKGSYKIGGVAGNVGNKDGLNAYYFVSKGNAATNCIFTADVSKVKTDKNDGSLCYPPSQGKDEKHILTNEMTDNYSSCSSAYNSMSSDISTSTGSSGTAWYKYMSLSHGYGASPYYNSGGTIYYYNVYLRGFISWSTISFAAGTGGSVDKTSVTVPSDYTSVSKSGNKAYVYNVTVTATPNSGYEFDYWDGNTARFKQTTFLVWFNAGTNTTQKASTGHCVVGEKYSVTPNTTVTIRFISYSKTGYSYVRISFVDAGGETRSMGYTANAGYYINYYSICDVDKTGSRTYTLTSGGDIDVTAYLKSYDVEFN